MTKTKMLSPVKRKEWVSAAETEARRGSSSSGAPSPRGRRAPRVRRTAARRGGGGRRAIVADEASATSPRRGAAEALAEARRLLAEERSRRARREASLAETRLQLDGDARRWAHGGRAQARRLAARARDRPRRRPGREGHLGLPHGRRPGVPGGELVGGVRVTARLVAYPTRFRLRVLLTRQTSREKHTRVGPRGAMSSTDINYTRFRPITPSITSCAR